MALLAQLRPMNTNAVRLFRNEAAGITVKLSIIHICNQSGADASYRIYYNNSGSRYRRRNALFWDIPIAADTTAVEEFYDDEIDNWSATIGVRSSVAGALTFTLRGRRL